MTHDRIRHLRELLAITMDSLAEAPADKRASLIAQSDRLSAELSAAEGALEDTADGLAPGRYANADPQAGSVTGLDEFRAALEARGA